MTPVVPSHPRITTGFKVKGPHWSTGEHSGIDYGSPGINGAEVRAPWSGTITGASWGSAYGNHVVIDFDRLPDGSPGLWGVIAHMSRVVKTRGRVERGELIGYVGATGNVTGPHTHFEIQPQAGWVRGSYRDPMPWHNAGGSGGGGGGDWKYAAGTVIDLRYLTWNGHLLNADKKSTSIGAWKDMMNHHSLVGGTNIPVTEEWGADIADETQKCQAQHLPPADPGRESVFVGPKQFQHVLEATGAPYVMKDSRPSGPAPQPPVSGVPACPPADQFKPGVSNPAFAWMGQRFLVWLSPQEIAHEGAAYEPGPRFSTYDEENIRKCQSRMGDVADPPGSAFFGPRQWARLADAPPYGGGGGTDGGDSSGGDVAPPPVPPAVDRPAAPALMYPQAQWDPIAKKGGGWITGLRKFTGTAKKVTIHTTETKVKPNWVQQQTGIPHFTIDLKSGIVWQHLSLDMAAYTLRGPDGISGQSPNADSGVNIQIEVIGYSADVRNWSDDEYDELAMLCSWICDVTGVPYLVPLPFAEAGRARRLGWAEWAGTSGIVGHEHAPHNDHCVDPDTPILMADLTWRRAGDLLEGDEIVAFDDEKEQGQKWRRFKTATITRSAAGQKEMLRLNTTRGQIVVSVDHPFLARVRDSRHGRRWSWVAAEDLVPGTSLAFLCEPWDSRRDYEAGYIAGSFDADGSIYISQHAVQIQHGGKPGVVIDAVVRRLEDDGFAVKATTRKQRPNSLTAGASPFTDVVLHGGIGEVMRFTGMYRPEKFLAADVSRIYEGRAVETVIHSGRNGAELLSVERLGDGPIASLTTSAGTFITAGFLTHNTDPGALDAGRLLQQLAPPEPDPPSGDFGEWLSKYWPLALLVGVVVLAVLFVLT